MQQATRKMLSSFCCNAALFACLYAQSAYGQNNVTQRDNLQAHPAAARPSVLVAQLDEKRSYTPNTYANNNAIAVIYPNVGEPFRGIFTKIIDGIEDKVKIKVKSIPIDSNSDNAEINAQLRKYGAKVVIALGRQGLKSASALDRDLTIVVGGILTLPEADRSSLTGVSFTPDPAVLFTRLKNLLPESRRVFVVYDPQHNESLIKLAREEARSHNLEIVAIPVSDLASAAKTYESIFSNIDNRRDAVWLPNDPTTVEENTILPLVLKLSWNSSVPIFSSNFMHVKKGALFALYPNNVELGRTLAHSALGILAGESRKRGVAPLRELHTAVNLRVASRIGLNLSYQQQRTFDFVFPEP